MAYVSLDKLWRSDLYNNVFARNRVQDFDLNQLKLKVNKTYKKDEKLTAKNEAVNDEVVINKAHLDTKISKIVDHLSMKEKNYNEVHFKNNKQSVEGILSEKKKKTTIQVL